MESDLPRTPARTVVGVVLGIAAAIALAIGALVFALHGYCEDSCDKPPWTFWGALSSALPFLVVGLALLTVACSLFMRRRRSVLRRWVVAGAQAVLSALALVGGLWVVVALAWSGDGLLLFGLLALLALWLWLTVRLVSRA